MAKNYYVIPPRVKLPLYSHPHARNGLRALKLVEMSPRLDKAILAIQKVTSGKPEKEHHTLRITLQEVGYLVLAGSLAYGAYQYLAQWPVFRIVAFVVILILWSNAASESAHVKAKAKTHTQKLIMSIQKQRKPEPVQSKSIDDTTGYLQALRLETFKR